MQFGIQQHFARPSLQCNTFSKKRKPWQLLRITG